MNDDRITSCCGWVRGLLVALGLPQLSIGLWALFGPRSFYGDFPGRRGWVEKLGPYDEHLVRDVGSLFVGLGALMLIAAVLLGRRLVLAAIVTWLLFAVPHAIYHMLNLGPYATGDAIANAATLGWTVVAPLIVLGLVLRGQAPVAD
jgi:hypothetical protein